MVLDTNVLVSGIFFTGPPLVVLRAWRDSRFVLLITRDICREYEAVLTRLMDQFPDVDARPALGLILANSQLVEPASLPEQVCIDPDDDKFIACAVAGGAQFLVSGDSHLLRVGAYEGVQVLRPRAFMDLLDDELRSR